ncbi:MULTISPECIES: lasso peptide biosynthesis B2 protein [Bacillaceae]|uniref:lasso peptide biosynthesis B2 protein n=1 Tax=Bacillaceae TaxID=186817 RepID=UPI00300027A3
MKLARIVKTFVLLDSKEKRLFIEAFIFLAWGRILKSMPFSKVAPILGEHMEESSFNRNPSEEKLLKNISNAIYIMSNYTPWQSKCLVKAIAAMKMLQRRQIDCTLYLGTGRDEDGQLAAHAWLRSGTLIITGEEVMDQFTVVGKFARCMNG